MPLISHERSTVHHNTRTRLPASRISFLEEFRKHSRSSDFSSGSFFFDLFLASMEFRAYIFLSDLIPLSRGRAWHGIYRLDLGLLGLAGRVTALPCSGVSDHHSTVMTHNTYNDTISRAETESQ